MVAETGNIGRSETIKGQSLVEFAIIAPLLIFFMVGILEVGIAIRDYITLVNANREAARFAVRPGYINPETGEGYMDVYLAIHQATSGQLQLDFAQNASVVINVINIADNMPCDPALREPPLDGDYWPNCDCEEVETNPWATPVITNSLNDSNYGWANPINATTRINITETSSKLATQNNVHNCHFMKKLKNVQPIPNQAVIVELSYDHYQFFGMPLVSNPLLDPINLYTHTVMRRSAYRKSPYSEDQ